MLKFIRTVDKSLEDFFILDLKTLGNLIDNVDDHSPDAFRYGKFNRVSCHFAKESAYSLIGREPSCRGQYVVLHGGDCGACNLRGEVTDLILSEAEIPFTVLEYDFQRPTHGVDAVGFLEFKFRVSCNQRVPVRLLVPFGKEQAYLTTCELNIHGDVVATKTTAVLAPLLGMVKKSDKRLSGIVLAIVVVLCLAHLYHAKVVTLDMAGGNELDDLGTCEPAICKDVVKVYLSGNKTLYHFNHERNLALVILLDTLCCMAVLVAFLSESGIKLLLLQAVRTLLALLTYKTEVHEHLSSSVSNTKEQTLEAENHLMLNMGEHLPDHLRLDASLRIVRIVNHETYWSLVIPLSVSQSLAPELGRDINEDVAPVVILPRKETIEHVFATVGYAA